MGSGATAPSSAFRLGKITINRGEGTATLVVTIPGPGLLTLTGRGIESSRKAVTRDGTVTLPVKPTGLTRERLRRTGKATVVIEVSYRPAGGTAATKKTIVTLAQRR